MNWNVWIFIVVIIMAYGLVRYAMSTALRTENTVGFEIIQLPDADGHYFCVVIMLLMLYMRKPETLRGTHE